MRCTAPLVLTLNLGTPPPNLPTVSAPLPTSPSIVHHLVMVDVEGQLRMPLQLHSGGGALAISLKPGSAGSDPSSAIALSALSMGSASSR